MLILLPPSEGKAEPTGKPADPKALSFAAELGPTRERLLAALGRELLKGPAARADRVYTGVLFARLDLPGLSAAGKRRAARQVLIASGLWGLLRPTDRICAYKLPIGEKLPGLGGLAGLWREPVSAVLEQLDRPREVVLDCRSAAYATVWRPSRAIRIEVRAFHELPDGKRRPISHMAKAARGDVARAVLEAETVPRSVEEVLSAATRAGIDAEVHRAGDGPGVTLDVIEHPEG